jgi:hypothetical protein
MRLFLLLIFLAFNHYSSGQVGIITLDANPETVPLGQWYTIRSKDYDNWMAFVDKPEISDSILIEMLAPWELTFEEAEFDEQGDMYWLLDNANGYTATVYRVKDGEDIMIQIQLELITEEEE